MHVVIVGTGALATALAKRCTKEKVSHNSWEPGKLGRKSVIIFCGSPRLFKDVWSFCSTNNTPLLLLSTSIDFPKRHEFPFVFAPNCSEEVLEFIKSVKDFATNTDYKNVSIIESHQKNKKDVSATAKLLAKSLGRTEKIIISIRNPKDQQKLGIPTAHLDGHAYHKVTFMHDGLSTEFSVTVLGRETYAKGALKIARDLLRKS